MLSLGVKLQRCANGLDKLHTSPSPAARPSRCCRYATAAEHAMRCCRHRKPAACAVTLSCAWGHFYCARTPLCVESKSYSVMCRHAHARHIDQGRGGEPCGASSRVASSGVELRIIYRDIISMVFCHAHPKADEADVPCAQAAVRHRHSALQASADAYIACAAINRGAVREACHSCANKRTLSSPVRQTQAAGRPRASDMCRPFLLNRALAG